MLQKKLAVTGDSPISETGWLFPVKLGNFDAKLAEIDRIDGYEAACEFVVYYYNGNESQPTALFRMIRNSFAHGAFRAGRHQGEIYYALENRYGKKLKGRAVLKEKTLLTWINVVKEGSKSKLRK